MHVTAVSFAGPMLVAAGGELFLNLLPWLAALVALVIIGGVAIFAAKRMLSSGGDSSAEGFTLQSLRDLHTAGELSDEEFAKAKAAMIGQVRGKSTAEATGNNSAGAGAQTARPPDKNTPANAQQRDERGPISK
jgi:uncharacterized membrane protein